MINPLKAFALCTAAITIQFRHAPFHPLQAAVLPACQFERATFQANRSQTGQRTCSRLGTVMREINAIFMRDNSILIQLITNATIKYTEQLIVSTAAQEIAASRTCTPNMSFSSCDTYCQCSNRLPCVICMLWSKFSIALHVALS